MASKSRSPWGPVMPTLHPAYVLRRGVHGLQYRILVDDLAKARRLAVSERGTDV